MTTIGVLITVPDPAGSELEDYRVAIGDPEVGQVPSHVTLLPPTEVAEAALPDVEEHLAGVAARRSPFRIQLNGTSTFRPVSPVVFVALAEGSDECARLAEEVRSGPLHADLAFPYHPHVTIAHNLDDAVLDRARDDFAGFDRSFQVGAIHLYIQRVGHGWSAARTFELQEA
jgi:2'-5' RNA ligase